MEVDKWCMLKKHRRKQNKKLQNSKKEEEEITNSSGIWYEILLTWVLVDFFGQPFDTSDTIVDKLYTVFSEKQKRV